MINKYDLIVDSEGYVISMTLNKNGNYILNPLCMNLQKLDCYKLVDNVLIFDEEKLAKLIAEEEEEAKLPTWREEMEAQVLYTALVTDSLVSKKLEE